jgi:hypothetical protein
LNNNQLRTRNKRLWNGLLALMLAAALLIPSFGNKAEAGKEGVYLGQDVYYTLEKAQLSPGSEKGTFRFVLELVNNSGSAVDINKYGAAIRDASGNRYGVELTEKASSRVLAGTAKQLKYSAKVPTGVTLDQLQVEIYSWDMNASGYIRSIGKLSASAAADSASSSKPQAIVDMSDLDSSYASDSLVNFELQYTHHAFAKGNWNIYTELTAENLGSTSFKLPSTFSVSLKNGSGLSYTGSVVYGADQSILPHQKATVILEFPVGDLDVNGTLAVEFGKKAAASSSNSSNGSSGSSTTGASNNASSSSSSTVTVLESMDITGSAAGLQKGDIQTNSASRTGLSAEVESVSLDTKSDGVYAETVYTLKNDGTRAVAVPTLTGFYQVGGSTLTVTAEDNASHPDFLAPGETTSYYYNGVLPNGVSGSSVQLVVQEKKSDTLSVPVSVAALPAVTDNTGTPVNSGGSSYATSIGKLGIKLSSTYRLLSDGGDDILMSEIQVENLQSEAVKLPSLYAGYTDGTNDIAGTVTYVQSSPYINAGQKAVLYVFTTLPYDIEMEKGKVYFGQGVLSNNNWTQKKEWARIAFETDYEAVDDVLLNDAWYINDPGRLSTAWVAETKLYDNTTSSDTGILAAVRIGQKNQLTRNGSVVPYAGYIKASNGEVYQLTATGSSGKLNMDGKALTTLWAKLPSGVLDDKAVVVFGQEINEDVFASPKQIPFSVSANQPGSTDGYTWKINESLYPYVVKFSNMTRVYSNGSYTFNFRYMLEKTSDQLGSNTNRVLHFELEDSEKNLVKQWDVPLEGTGAMENNDDDGEVQSLKVTSSEIPDSEDFLNGNRIKVYEKFEGHLRHIGTMTYNMYDN